MTDRAEGLTLDEVLDAELARYADSLKRLGGENDRQRTVWVVTRWRQFETGAVYATREAAEKALAASLNEDRRAHETNPFESVHAMPWSRRNMRSWRCQYRVEATRRGAQAVSIHRLSAVGAQALLRKATGEGLVLRPVVASTREPRHAADRVRGVDRLVIS